MKERKAFSGVVINSTCKGKNSETSRSSSMGNFLVMVLFFFLLFFNLTILYWFCHISTWIRHRYTCVPHPEPSSLLPPHTIPLGRPSAPTPSIQYRASNLDWWLISYMILYMFQCHSPRLILSFRLLRWDYGLSDF